MRVVIYLMLINLEASTHNSDGESRWLSRQAGAHVWCFDNSLVCKQGDRVRYGEEVAMRLVKQHTNAPIPDIIFSNYESGNGSISMTFIPGQQLKLVWDNLDERNKERVCQETWAMITQWRKIPPPPHLNHLYRCLADGSPATEDPLLKDLDETPTPLLDDEAVRTRIYRRYLRYFGERYADELPSMLPRSDVSVFTHADIAPHNIMADQNGHITGIIDWERAGWYPDYWEYANIMKPPTDGDWQKWMDRTAPQRWDLSGLVAARRVLF